MMPTISIRSLGGGELAITRPDGDTVSLADPDVIADPYPLYERLREIAPRFRSRSLFSGSWVFLDRDDVAALSRNTEQLSNSKFRALVDQLNGDQREQFEPLVRLHSRWMVFYDPPDHTRLRRVMSQGFTRAVIDGLVPFLRQTTADLIQGMADRRSIDAVSEYAAGMPLSAVARILGIDREDLPHFARWTGDIAAYMGSEKAETAIMRRAQQSLLEFKDYFKHVIRGRRTSRRRDDFLRLLMEAEEGGDVLSTEDLFAQCTLIGFTGNVTTKNLIGNAIYTLLRHPSAREQLAADPSLIDGAVEEVLRFECPVQFLGRLVKASFNYRGIDLRRGEYIVLMIGAANRDPSQFPEPATFDIARPENPHISFGEGVHACLGQGLARMEAQIAVGEFLAAFPHARLDPTDEPNWLPNPGLRGLGRLPVQLR